MWFSPEAGYEPAFFDEEIDAIKLTANFLERNLTVKKSETQGQLV